MGYIISETRDNISINNSPTSMIYDVTIIIDDILPFSNHIPIFLQYFSSVAQIFTK